MTVNIYKMYNQLGFDTEIYRNPLLWKLFWVTFIKNVCHLDDKHSSEQNITIKLLKKSNKIVFQSESGCFREWLKIYIWAAF